MKTLNQISSIIIALLFVYTINFKSFVTISYFANQAEITELFCINKEKPVLKCNGKCHLTTQLTEIGKQSEDSPFSQNSLNYNLEINLALVSNLKSLQPKMGKLDKVTYFNAKTILCNGFYSITSPPPKA